MYDHLHLMQCSAKNFLWWGQWPHGSQKMEPFFLEHRNFVSRDLLLHYITGERFF